MELLVSQHIERMNKWIVKNARLLEKAKWNYLFYDGAKDAILNELLKYQNKDGGFGNGLESDIFFPGSSAVASAEAIFLAIDYDLDCKKEWFKQLLDYFERTIQSSPSFWESVPKEIEEYPHAQWWSYEPDIKFSPNPCAVIASALILHGDNSQKAIGYTVANKCIDFLLSDEVCDDHQSYNLLRLIEVLLVDGSNLVTNNIISAMKRRIEENVCYDESKWVEYYAQPLDYASNFNSLWISSVEEGIDNNFRFWLSSINSEGVWNPNFSWNQDNDSSRMATRNWTGYVTVKRARIFKEYNRIRL